MGTWQAGAERGAKHGEAEKSRRKGKIKMEKKDERTGGNRKFGKGERDMAYLRADRQNPFMGLDNKVCKDPAYWCRTHGVWLSEKDVERKRCKCKPTFDMVGTRRCKNLERKRGGRPGPG